MSAETNQFEISKPPSDGISCVKWFNNSNHLVCTSWDKSISLYNISSEAQNDEESKEENNTLIHRYYSSAGVLDCCISFDDSEIFSGGCDNKLYSFDISTLSKPRIIGEHLSPIRCIEYINSSPSTLLISGSWDKTCKIWDIKCDNNSALINNLNLPNKIFALSAVESTYYLVIGIAGRSIWIYDLRNLNEPIQKRESSLKHQTRSIKCHPNGEQYVVSSIEGRVAVEYFNVNKEIQNKKYAFKCHRVTDKTTGMQTIYPVNSIAFHPIWKTFATGGGDGVVNIWDGENKKRICQFPPYNTSIASLDFNKMGNLIAIASSYTWEHGDKERPKDAIWCRKIKESEAKPKLKK